MKVVVVGAGFAGACAAWSLRQREGVEVRLLEGGPRPGGMLRTLTHPESGLPYEYGPRVVSHFRGTIEGVHFVRRFLDLEEQTVYQGTRLLPGRDVVPFPVDRHSLHRLPEGELIEQELRALEGREPDETNLRTYLETSVGPTLTRLAFTGFNRKFWGRELEDMPAEWGKLRRLETVAEQGSYRLPSQSPHYYPRGGFNPLFDELLREIDVEYDVQLRRVRPLENGVELELEGSESCRADVVICTAPIDDVFGRQFGALEWRGYRLDLEVQPAGELGQAPDEVPFAWIYTPWEETPVCRTTDYGVIHHGPGHTGPAIISREIPDDAVRMYPVSWDESRLSRYLEHAAGIPGFVPLGRLGLYKYVTIDSTFAMVERMLEHFQVLCDGDPDARYAGLRRVRGDWSD